MIESLKTGVRDLNPAYFALVMATGIISIAAWFHRMPRIAETLFVLNNLLYILLWLLTLARLTFFRSRLLTDLAGHASGPGCACRRPRWWPR